MTAKPPNHLSATARKWWASTAATFELEAHHLHLLTLAAEMLDRAAQARAVLDKLGLTYEDRFGAPRARPEVNAERHAKIAFARLLRELDLDGEPPPSTSRPPALRSNRDR
jgi:phage terminase small subunit